MKKSRFWPIDERLAYWHPVLRLADLGKQPQAVMVCGVPIALFRTRTSINAVYDELFSKVGDGKNR